MWITHRKPIPGPLLGVVGAYCVTPGDPHQHIYRPDTQVRYLGEPPYLCFANRADPTLQKIAQKWQNINTECP